MEGLAFTSWPAPLPMYWSAVQAVLSQDVMSQLLACMQQSEARLNSSVAAGRQICSPSPTDTAKLLSDGLPRHDNPLMCIFP